MREFFGNVPQLVYAYTWCRAMGAEGIDEASDVSVLLNNYMEKRLLEIRGVTKSHPHLTAPRMEMTRYSLGQVEEDTGVTVFDFQNRMADFGIDAFWLSHEPWVVPAPFTPEAGEMWSKEDVDEWIDVLAHVVEEAYSDPELVRTRAPQPRDREARLDRPERSGELGDHLPRLQAEAGRGGRRRRDPGRRLGQGRAVAAAATALLDGRVALVTGGSRGLGAAIARAFAAAGATGAVADLEAGAAPDGWHALAADVSVEAEVEAAVAETVERFGRLDVVVANAGIVPAWSDTAELDLEQLDRVFAVNVRGVAATLKHGVRALRDHAGGDGGGSIVVMASLNAWRAHPSQPVYTASKHAVLGLLRTAALDAGRHGIRVNGLGPGPILTDALRDRLERRAAEGGLPFEEALAQAAAGTALGRMATEEDVANAALFLASDLSAGITGALLPVDGGIA